MIALKPAIYSYSVSREFLEQLLIISRKNPADTPGTTHRYCDGP